nr:HAMP domain-containing sensor histidine kinase [uncultured Mediterraneibacter sp.]
MIKKVRSRLFAKIFIITMLLTSFCCMITYAVISWIVPKTYSTTLDEGLDEAANTLISEIENMAPSESGKLFDEFILNNSDVLLQLFDSSDNEIELPSQSGSMFPVIVTGGVATESDDPAAYRATHRYIFNFADSDEIYTLTVAGSAQEVNLLKDTLAGIFLILFLVILLVAALASFLYSQYVTKPVLRISSASKKMANLDFNWKCEENRTDELGILAHSLNKMSRRLSASMTDLKNANEKLKADIEHERELEQAQLDFFSAVSHELKTPITVIKGQTEGMLLNVGDYQNRNKYLKRSLEIINTMESMVQEILTIARMKSFKIMPAKEKFCFSDMLKQEYVLFEDLIVQKGLNWIENITSDIYMTGDKMLMQKAVNNLASNAVSYSPENSSIYLTALAEEGKIRLEIENTGVHIPDADLPKLFDAFYRVDHSRNKKTGGSGLGLYIVKTILEQHQAQYCIENTERGVLFTVQLVT